MKKVLLFAVVGIGLSLFALVSSVKAGNQYNWGTSTGANWRTPDDTTVQIGQALVVTSSVPYPTVGTSSTTPMGIASQTLTQINASTPSFIGQIVFCNTCVQTLLCVSTETTTSLAFASVTSTSTTGPAINPCK